AFTEIFNISHPTNWTLHIDLDDGLEYQYKIRAWDQVGLSSPFTNIVSFVLTDITPPAVPTNFSVKPVLDGDELILNWDRNFDDSVNYEIYWTESLTRAWQKLINISHPTNSTIWSDFVLVNGSTHYFKIRAWDEVPLASAFTLPVSVVHRDYIEPDTPTNLIAIAQSEHIIDLSWSASLATDVEGYRLYINHTGADSSGPYKFLAETDKLTLDHEVGNLLENVAYYFVVSAFDEANNPSPLSIWAKATTIAIPPAIPVLDELPDYTNKTKLDVTGTAELNTTVLVINNNLEAGNVSTDAEGIFRIEIDLEENANVINAHAVDFAKLASNDSESQVVILDTALPTADAGPDINVSLGGAIIFNASGSSDNYEIGNYSWGFEYFEGEYVSVYGREKAYIFDSPGIYEVTLKVTDLAGNWAIDVLNVNVIQVVRPIVEHTIPSPNEQNLPITETVTITFNTTMNTTTVENALSISPAK
ncbi:MAG: hypothetical protein KAJ51_13090, partial [Thermoplasmata archaeon]|nr:hypothetical protein [Thermoplasmata archaeon]